MAGELLTFVPENHSYYRNERTISIVKGRDIYHLVIERLSMKLAIIIISAMVAMCILRQWVNSRQRTGQPG